MCLTNTYFDYLCSIIYQVNFMEHPMYSLRILSKGQILDLSKGFSLGEGVPFSAFVRPTRASMETNILLDCKLICDKESGSFPVPLGDWTPGVIVSISPNAISLEDYEIYWGAGEQIK